MFYFLKVEINFHVSVNNISNVKNPAGNDVSFYSIGLRVIAIR